MADKDSPSWMKILPPVAFVGLYLVERYVRQSSPSRAFVFAAVVAGITAVPLLSMQGAPQQLSGSPSNEPLAQTGGTSNDSGKVVSSGAAAIAPAGNVSVTVQADDPKWAANGSQPSETMQAIETQIQNQKQQAPVAATKSTAQSPLMYEMNKETRQKFINYVFNSEALNSPGINQQQLKTALNTLTNDELKVLYVKNMFGEHSAKLSLKYGPIAQDPVLARQVAKREFMVDLENINNLDQVMQNAMAKTKQ